MMSSPLIRSIQHCQWSIPRLHNRCALANQFNSTIKTHFYQVCRNQQVRHLNSLSCQYTRIGIQRAATLTSCLIAQHNYHQSATLLPCLQHARHFHSQVALLAGHSKWANIKATKGAKDHQKSLLFMKYAKMIKIAVKEGGGTNPALNSQLANVLQIANSKDMPKSTIENTLKNATKTATPDVRQVYEVKGPGGCGLIAEILTDAPLRTKQEIHVLLKKEGVSIESSGSLMYAFERKGVVRAKGDPSMTLDLATEVAIEVEAEDVQETTNEDGENVFMFICEPSQVKSVKENLTSQSYNIESAGLEYVPVQDYKVEMAGANLERVSQIIQKLEEHADVLKVYDNITIAD